MKSKIIPVMKTRCTTCPFNDGGWVEVRPLLEARVLSMEGTPICHSTGVEPLTTPIHNEQHACRGARDLQLQMLYRVGFLSVPTDDVWEEKVGEMIRHNKNIALG